MIKLRNYLLRLLAGKSEIAINLYIKNGRLKLSGENGYVQNCTLDNTGVETTLPTHLV